MIRKIAAKEEGHTFQNEFRKILMVKFRKIRISKYPETCQLTKISNKDYLTYLNRKQNFTLFMVEKLKNEPVRKNMPV